MATKRRVESLGAKHPNSEPPQKIFMVETVNFQLMNMFEWYRQKASFLKRLADKALSSES